MKKVVLLFCGLVVMLSATKARAEFVEVTTPYANVYEFLDPKSTIITQAKKGDHFELVYAGTSWYQVKVKEKVGWLERRAGEVVSNPGKLPVVSIALLAVVLIGTLGGVFFVIQKQRNAEHSDLASPA